MVVYKCKICKLEALPIFSTNCKKEKRAKRIKSEHKTASNKKEKQTQWIFCDSCEEWIHPRCCGVTAEECEGTVKFKCIVCCIKAAIGERKKSEVVNLVCSAIIERVNKEKESSELSNNTNLRNKNNKLKRQTKANKQDCVLLEDDQLEEKGTHEIDTKGKCRETNLEEETPEGRGKKGETESNENFAVITEEGLKEKLEDKERSKGASGSEIRTEEESTGISQSEDEINKEINLKVNQEEIRDRILIIDEINDPSVLKDSRAIYKEIKKYCPDLKIDHAYNLARGGVAIHLTTSEDREKLKNTLPKESFGGGEKKNLSRVKLSSFFIKNVILGVHLDSLKNKLEEASIKIHSVERVKHFKFQRPSKVVKILIDPQSVNKINELEILINGEKCPIEPQHLNPVIRCFGCQSFGHSATNCRSLIRCVTCAESHSSVENCSGIPKCVNCKGNHQSASFDCPIYQEKYEYFASKYTIY